MKTLTVNFEHCHGIAKLSHRFKFSNRSFAIYAPNGTMKTSFAKTFDEYSRSTDTKDNAFPDNATVREITIDDANTIDRETILVIEPYNESYKSEKITTLLANKELKGQYEKLHKIIDEHQNTIIKKLKMLSGIGKDEIIHKEIQRVFGNSLINTVKSFDTLDDFLEPELSEFKIADITKDKIQEVLKDNASELQDYVDKYNELLNKSKYLKKEFNFYNIETINKQLENNNFFKNGHSVQLSDGETSSIFHSSKELKDLCEIEKKQLLADTDLLKKFEKINKKLDGHTDLREFRALLTNKPEVMIKLNNLNQFERDIWISYFYKEKELVQELVKEHTFAQSQIAEIIAKANDQKTGWEDAIDIFNDRFIHLPFSLKISNKSDSILNSNIVPVVDFEFQSKGRTKLYNENEKKLY